MPAKHKVFTQPVSHLSLMFPSGQTPQAKRNYSLGAFFVMSAARALVFFHAL
jgi:hypothetical protein